MGKRWLIVAAIALARPVLLLAADRSATPILSRIRHTPVESRGVAAVGYSKRLHALEMQFWHGGTYRYFDVPTAVYRELLASDSTARYYNTHIRGRDRCVRVRSAAAGGASR